ncbi:hypothetical protein CH35J_004999 [Colletotrichum higginsianum]|uniref:Uncharacterized protein n=1 Tax=Colletotrichum higginsianum TaxID=80884 RepID=A0A4T0W377_9PEZI|nr:hypothetical protein CH35J_004999 [Colletotrichum higginsianum]
MATFHPLPPSPSPYSQCTDFLFFLFSSPFSLSLGSSATRRRASATTAAPNVRLDARPREHSAAVPSSSHSHRLRSTASPALRSLCRHPSTNTHARRNALAPEGSPGPRLFSPSSSRTAGTRRPLASLWYFRLGRSPLLPPSLSSSSPS